MPTELTPSAGQYYVTEDEFRTKTGMQAADVSQTAFNNLVVSAHSWVVSHAGTWDGTEDAYSRVQDAEAYLIAHLSELRTSENPPVSDSDVNATSTRWLQLYRDVIFELTGNLPFPAKAAGYGMKGSGGGGAFNAGFKTVTPDEDSYTSSTTR